jgi:hypothetical protein
MIWKKKKKTLFGCLCFEKRFSQRNEQGESKGESLVFTFL